jgi:hypothetical protein
MKPGLPDYGLDAPKLVRLFLIGGFLLLGVGLALFLFSTEQRRPGANRPWPEGLRRFWLGALWRLGSQRGGSAPLLAPTPKPKTTQQTGFYPAVRSVVRVLKPDGKVALLDIRHVREYAAH